MTSLIIMKHLKVKDFIRYCTINIRIHLIVCVESVLMLGCCCFV